MDFKKIVEKYNYSSEFSLFLEQVYRELINYYGNEELVFNALYNTKIVSVLNVYNYLKDNNLLDSNNTMVQDGDLKRSSGVYQSIPQLSYSNGNFRVDDIERVVAVVDFDLNDSSKKATLIHELCHLIKSYYNEYTIVDNKLITRSGLIESTYELKIDNGIVTKELIKEDGVGLEEGLTSVVEEEISRNIILKEYKSSGYGVVNVIARNLLEIPNISNVIINAELYHDYKEIFSILDIFDYRELIRITDEVYKLVLLMFSQIFEQEKMQDTAKKINEILINYYKPLNQKISEDISTIRK